MDKLETYAYLDRHGVAYEVTEHRAVYNMADVADVELPHTKADAKNLFLRDDKRRNYYLVCLRAEKRLDLRTLRRSQGTRPLSFASPHELQERLGLTPGSVTPLGLLDAESRSIPLILDRGFAGELIGVHPNDNTATVWLQTDDLVRLVREHGNPVWVVEL